MKYVKETPFVDFTDKRCDELMRKMCAAVGPSEKSVKAKREIPLILVKFMLRLPGG